MNAHINVRFFASPVRMAGAERHYAAGRRDFAGVAGPTLRGYPALEAQRVRFAVNQAYASLNTPLHDGDEVACIPPVGGG